MRRRLLWLAAGIALLGIAVAVSVSRRLAPAAEEASEVLFVVENGDSLGRIARRLEDTGLVRDARVVEWLARLRGLAESLQAGEYYLSAAARPAAILEQIASGRVATHAVSVPEGFTAVQIAARLEEAGLAVAADFEAVANDAAFAAELELPADRLEGYLFPETYRLPRGKTARAIAREMVEQFRRVWADLESGAERRGLEMHEVVTLASIVEKETGAESERALIASVFANRLARGMRLESDPTTIYGIPDFDGNLRRRGLENPDNPYNTYRIPALPPGPIASPGRAALAAVVEPAESEYLFFVSRNDGTHVFSKTYREHVNAVNRYQLRRSSK
jgi:UPF0755 protein